ncbi:DMT family transporter [Allosediminivita pacifica]|uniref:Drug/metabolite transporter (DMT)-like permease n=1 Tax=Allosediminivita pacifica TaxID=1267769 RepID=A0A2T6B3Y1_9RHOB|nr:DMT family transporter [Allosediminivita pacifica]PTX50789.1 drug/metabolite transporter (DMT)-like permease [Allosediminivita pacifica]GGB01171.1 transporter RarD family, DMT superfamily protein [Allosediminivita pacifica]
MHPLRGIAFKTSAILLFTVMSALIKASSSEVPPGEAVFFRSFFAMPVIVAWLFFRGELRTGFHTDWPMGHVWRGVVGVTAMGCGFAALGLLPLPEVTALGYAAPLMTVLLAALLLGERLRAFRISAVLVGLVGVLIVLWPRISVDNLDQAATMGVALMMVSAAMRALAQVHVRRLVATEQTSAIVFWFSMTATVLSLFTLPFGWQVPSAQILLCLIMAGLIGGFGQILLTTAYRHAEAAVLAPFDYASLLFAILIGYTVFDEVPTTMVLLGSSVVMSAGGAIVWRERQLGLQRGRARPNMTPNG